MDGDPNKIHNTLTGISNHSRWAKQTWNVGYILEVFQQLYAQFGASVVNLCVSQENLGIPANFPQEMSSKGNRCIHIQMAKRGSSIPSLP